LQQYVEGVFIGEGGARRKCIPEEVLIILLSGGQGQQFLSYRWNAKDSGNNA